MSIKYHLPGRVETSQINDFASGSILDFTTEGYACRGGYGTVGYYAREEIPGGLGQYLGYHYNIETLEALAPTREEVAANPLKYISKLMAIQSIGVMSADAFKAETLRNKIGSKLNIPSNLDPNAWGRSFTSEMVSIPIIGQSIVKNLFDEHHVVWNRQCGYLSVALIIDDVMSPVWALECKRGGISYRIIKPNVKSALAALEELVIEKVKLDDLIN